MASIIKVADTSEIAFYRDGSNLHVGLVAGHNDGIDSEGRNHADEYQARRAAGEHPFQHYEDVAVHPVKSYRREDGAIVKAHWRTSAGDVDRLVAAAESDFHKMAKQACYELLRDGKFNQIVRTGIKHFVFSGCAQEHPVRIGADIFYADVGAWDARFYSDPVAFEITYTSANSARKIDAFRDNDMVLYNIKIYEATRQEIKDGNLIDVQFYKDMMLRKRFHRMGGPNKSKLEVEYIRIQEAIDAAEFERRQGAAKFLREMSEAAQKRADEAAHLNGQERERARAAQYAKDEERRNRADAAYDESRRKIRLAEEQERQAWLAEQAKPKPTRMLFCGICRAWETPEHRCEHIAEILEAMPWTIEHHTVG